MESQLDLVSLTLSVFLHVSLALLISLFQGFSLKTRTVVDVSSFSIDTKVKSNFISTKSNNSRFRNSLSNKGITDVPKGIRVGSSTSSSSFKTASNKIGNGFSSGRIGGVGSKASNRFISGYKGNHGITLSLSMGLFNREGHGYPKTMQSRIAGYLLDIKRRILSNWQNPDTIPIFHKSVIVECSLDKSGRITSLNFEKLSNDSLFNRSAVTAIYKSEPFPPVPFGIRKIALRVRFEAK